MVLKMRLIFMAVVAAGFLFADAQGQTWTQMRDDAKSIEADAKKLSESPEQRKLVDDVGTLLGRLENRVAKGKEPTGQDKNDNVGLLAQYRNELKKLQDQENSDREKNDRKGQPSSAANAIDPTKLDERISKLEQPTDLLSQILYLGIPSLLLLGLFGGGGYLLYRIARSSDDKIINELGGLRRKQADLAKNLDAYMKVSTDLSQQLANHKSEIAKLKQTVGSQASSSFAPPPPSVEFAPREQPRFPVSVDDYLAKNGANSLAVKYDYKEGMLVQDSGSEGGLLVVQDDGRTYLVPSFGFFQTKSDYTNYFERYYSCDRPMGGNVWIKRPATVMRTDGGWRLDSPGELEVR